MKKPEKKEVTLREDFKERFEELECRWDKSSISVEKIAEIIYSLKDDKGQLPPDIRVAKAIKEYIDK